jgi:hypothetical protein
MGDTTSNHASSGNPFQSSGGFKGYVRQKNSSHSVQGNTEEFGLRSDIGRDRGVTTVIGRGNGSQPDLEGGIGMSKGAWNNSVSKLTEVSSDEERERDDARRREEWKGIRKTTVSTQVAD